MEAARGNGHGELGEIREHTRVMLQPIAAPSILGLFGFAGATFIVAAHLAGWYGTAESPAFLFPFAAMFGGLAQFLAGMWAFKARDGVATAMHGMWGSFWLAYGILSLLVAVGVYAIPTGSFPELGFWFLVLAAITALGTVAAVAENLGLFTTLGSLAVGAAFLAVHYLTGIHWWEVAGGWILIGSAVAATYTAGAMMLEGAWGKVVLPLGKVEREANVPGARVTLPIEYEHAEPGVRMGQ
ncbi:MAG TPA: GPR1/FUN34/YaaH family transporter [Solirubrobacterales bacterium]|nr:GPR1/FUN34/YaaH family transporter [Solirubrobacterales bacterium]